MKQDNRRTLLIDPYFQKRFIAYTVSLSVGISLFYYLAIRAFFWSFQSKGDDIYGRGADCTWLLPVEPYRRPTLSFGALFTICS